MYRYDAIDHQFLTERVAQFRDQLRRWQAGELAGEEFRPLRLQNGLYIQRHAPMLRIAVPYGMLSSAQLRQLAFVARTYDKGYGHFTTRHNMQFNWPKLEDCPDILGVLAEVDLHGIQTSGNCIRNITTDQFAGVAPDEIIDPRPLAEILRQWSTFHPEFAFLPRKFKFAISGTREDRAVTWFHDIGLHLVQGEGGETGFRVIVGGGLGRTPIRGQVVREYLPWQHILTYCEAILRVYNLHGRRDNAYKARIKILVQALGVEEFARQVEAEWTHLKDGPATLTQAEFDRVAAHFTAPDYATLPAESATFAQQRAADPAFARWAARSVHGHQVPGYAAVTLSLKRHGQAPGDITADQMDLVADLADQYSFGELRTSHEQNVILADVRQDDLFDLWQKAKTGGLATPQHRAPHRHHLLPRRRSVRPGQRQVGAHRQGHPGPLRRPGLPVRPGRNRPQHLRLHERLRPPPRGPHRRPRGGQERGRVLPGHPGRSPGQRGQAGQGHRPLLLGRGNARGGGQDHPGVRGQPPRGRALPRHPGPHRHRPVQEPRLRRPRPRRREEVPRKEGSLMSTLIKHGTVVADSWTTLALGEGESAQAPESVALPAGPVLFPTAVWLARRQEILARNEPIGLALAPADDVATIAGDLAHFAVIAVEFPKFTDGRGYSQARLLRERHGYTGELRAVGDVLHDQLFFMARVGFDAFALKDGKNAEYALAAGFTTFSEAYQTAVDRPQPFFRRRAA